jgi:COP9 signalosome complex subunit 2
LKYLVLASMLMESHVDPFNAQETKPYRADPQIQAMTDLVEAYQSSDINKFERVLRASKATVLEDPFIRPYIEDLITVLRTQVCPCLQHNQDQYPSCAPACQCVMRNLSET